MSLPTTNLGWPIQPRSRTEYHVTRSTLVYRVTIFADVTGAQTAYLWQMRNLPAGHRFISSTPTSSLYTVGGYVVKATLAGNVELVPSMPDSSPNAAKQSQLTGITNALLRVLASYQHSFTHPAAQPTPARPTPVPPALTGTAGHTYGTLTTIHVAGYDNARYSVRVHVQVTGIMDGIAQDRFAITVTNTGSTLPDLWFGVVLNQLWEEAQPAVVASSPPAKEYSFPLAILSSDLEVSDSWSIGRFGHNQTASFTWVASPDGATGDVAEVDFLFFAKTDADNYGPDAESFINRGGGIRFQGTIQQSLDSGD